MVRMKQGFWQICRRIPVLIVLMILSLICSIRAGAASEWSLKGDAFQDGNVFCLTRASTCKAGGLVKSVPIDTREGLTLSFRYRVGDSINQKREGFQIVFASKPVSIGWYAALGYDAYVTDKDLIFYGIEFHSYDRSHVAAVTSGDYSASHIEIAGLTISDGIWHDVTVKYGNGNVQVYQDQELVLTSSGFQLPDMVYLGFTAGTSYWGMQSHAISDISLKSQNACLVRLNANGGSCDADSVYALKNSVAALPTPSRTSFRFDGWYTDRNGGTRVDGRTCNFTPNQTLYAHWTDLRCKVNFHAGKGTISKKTRLIDPGNKVGSLPVPKRSGYTFLGWYTKKTGGVKITSDRVIRKNTTFYAHWARNSSKINIKLYSNGGSCSKSVLTVTYGGKLTGLPKATRKGYEFLGWYTQKSGGTKVKASTKTVKILPSAKLYAHWAKKATSGSNSGGSGSGSGSNKFVPSCVFCNGSGRCSRCGGDGYTYSFAMDNERLNCYKCNASGKCSFCHGSGKRY